MITTAFAIIYLILLILVAFVLASIRKPIKQQPVEWETITPDDHIVIKPQPTTDDGTVLPNNQTTKDISNEITIKPEIVEVISHKDNVSPGLSDLIKRITTRNSVVKKILITALLGISTIAAADVTVTDDEWAQIQTYLDRLQAIENATPELSMEPSKIIQNKNGDWSFSKFQMGNLSVGPLSYTLKVKNYVDIDTYKEYDLKLRLIFRFVGYGAIGADSGVGLEIQPVSYNRLNFGWLIGTTLTGPAIGYDVTKNISVLFGPAISYEGNFSGFVGFTLRFN